MADIVIPRDRLPKVTVGEQGWMSCDSVSFSPATSLKLARLWALRYMAIAEFLEAQEEQQSQTSETDRALAVNAETLYGKALSKCTDQELEACNLVLQWQQKAGEVPTKEVAETDKTGVMVDTSETKQPA